MAATATSSTSSALTKSGNAAPVRPSVAITRVAIRDGKTIAINDHIYVSAPWAPGSGDPYIIARVMDFVTASSSRKGAQTVESSSGTLQVRANIYLRQRDLHNKALSDPRLLVATMHSDIFALENVRGICNVRHRDLIGEAPQLSAWKKREDHFIYHQLYDRYLHRTYDVIPTDKIRNVPFDVLTVLRNRYSFVVAEPSTAPDLCGALRACSSCQKWASSAESVRCDTCKKYFHMLCLSPPLASKPAKGYSWTCAPCSRRHETTASGLPLSRTAALDASAAISSSSSSEHPDSASYTLNRLSDQQSSQRGGASVRGSRGKPRGRGRGGAAASQVLSRAGLLVSDDVVSDQSRESSPSPGLALSRRTIDDERGSRCFNRWPYRYFGECTLATDILDPYDSIYPRATPRIGVKFQASPVSWEEQKLLGLGVRISKEVESSDGTLTPTAEEPIKVKRAVGRPAKKKKEETPTGTPILSAVGLPATNAETSLLRLATDKEIERGGEESVEALYLPGQVEEKTVDKYIKVCKKHLPDVATHVGMLNRALKLLTYYRGEAGRALHELTKVSNEDLELDPWSPKETKQFHTTVMDFNADLRYLKREIATKSSAQIVRHFAQWKCRRLGEQFAEEKARSEGRTAEGQGAVVPKRQDQSTRAISPSLSIFDDSGKASSQTQLPSKVCKMCNTPSSVIWYKGPVVWLNRRLCIHCGMYWRKYAAEMPSTHPDMVMTRKRDAASHDDGSLGLALPPKAAKMARTESMKPSSPAQSSSTTGNPTAARFEPGKCVLCKKMEPRKRLGQCRQCSLSVHQGCYGLSDEELEDESWLCEACSNERTLDAALTPQCILCPRSGPASRLLPSTGATSLPDLGATMVAGQDRQTGERNGGRVRKSVSNPPSASQALPLNGLDAVKPTECNNWTHFACALFMPDVVFTEPQRMRIVEGAGNLPLWRYEGTCDLCNQQEGAIVECSEPSCKRLFHVSCASQQSSFTMGLDLVPVKSTRRDTVLTATFRGETGHMSAVVYCNLHKEAAKARQLLDLADTDASGLTATQVFASTHKGVKSGSSLSDQSSYPLLRRAKRFDAVLSSSFSSIDSVIPIVQRRGSKQPIHHTFRLSTSVAAEDGGNSSSMDDGGPAADDKSLVSSQLPSPAQHRQCLRCSTTFSPFWWDLPSNAQEADRSADERWIHSARNPDGRPERPVLCVRCRHSVLPLLVM